MSPEQRYELAKLLRRILGLHDLAVAYALIDEGYDLGDGRLLAIVEPTEWCEVVSGLTGDRMRPGTAVAPRDTLVRLFRRSPEDSP